MCCEGSGLAQQGVVKGAERGEQSDYEDAGEEELELQVWVD